MQNYINSVTSTNGDAVAGATVTVLRSDGTVPVLYAANGSSPYASNVLTADSKGQYSFYASNGTYSITVSSPNFTGQTQSGIVLFDPADSGPVYVGALGAVPGTADSGAALQSILTQYAGTGKTLTFAGNTFTTTLPLTVDRCVIDLAGGTLRASGLGSTIDLITQTGSNAGARCGVRGGVIDMNNSGRDAIRWYGNTSGMDYPFIDSLNIINCVRDGVHREPGGAFCWIENGSMRNIRVLSPGRHCFAYVMTNASTVFDNKGVNENLEGRGAGRLQSGTELYVENNASAGAGKISGHVFNGVEFDAAGATFHLPNAIWFNQLGSVGQFNGFVFNEMTCEDTAGTVTKTTAIGITVAGSVNGLRWNGEGISGGYTDFVDRTMLTGVGASVRTANSSKTFDLYSAGETVRFAPNDNAYLQPSGFTDQIKTPGILWGALKQRRNNAVPSAGAVTLAVGDNRVNLSAAVTSITMPSGTGAELDGAIVHVRFIEDATGGWGISGWLSGASAGGVKFAGGTFTPTTTAFAANTITLEYDSGQARWYELARAINVT